MTDAEWTRMIIPLINTGANVLTVVTAVVGFIMLKRLFTFELTKNAVAVLNAAKLQARETIFAAERVEQAQSSQQLELARITILVNEVNEVSKSSHVMINSNYSVALKNNVDLAIWKADREPTEANIIALHDAEKLLADHTAAQERADVKAPPAGFGPMPKDDSHDELK